MSVFTTEPCVQVYTANHTHEMVVPAFGHKTQKHCAVCMETQRPPNAINFEEFEDMVILHPGQRLESKTVHKFTVRNQ